jgi:hypothetical protein
MKFLISAFFLLTLVSCGSQTSGIWRFEGVDGEVIEVKRISDLLYYMPTHSGEIHHCAPYMWQDPKGYPLAQSTVELSPPKVASYISASGVKEKLGELDSWTLDVSPLTQLGTRFHDTPAGVETSQIVADLFAAANNDLEISFVSHPGSSQRSVIATLIGESEETIVLGAHLDTIASNRDDAPGADDDASGVMTLVEIARKLKNTPLQRTVAFHAYAMEEMGLIGSQQIAAGSENVIAMLQLDMTSYGSTDIVYLVSNSTSPQLRRDLKNFINNYLGIDWLEMPLRGGRSDHVSWHNRSTPAVFPFEKPDAYNPNIHTAMDTQIHNPDLARHFAKLALAFTLHYAGQASSLGTQIDHSLAKSSDLKIAITTADVIVSSEQEVTIVEICSSTPSSLNCLKERQVMEYLGDRDSRRIFAASKSDWEQTSSWLSIFAYDDQGELLARRQIRLGAE